MQYARRGPRLMSEARWEPRNPPAGWQNGWGEWINRNCRGAQNQARRVLRTGLAWEGSKRGGNPPRKPLGPRVLSDEPNLIQLQSFVCDVHHHMATQTKVQLPSDCEVARESGVHTAAVAFVCFAAFWAAANCRFSIRTPVSTCFSSIKNGGNIRTTVSWVMLMSRPSAIAPSRIGLPETVSCSDCIMPAPRTSVAMEYLPTSSCSLLVRYAPTRRTRSKRFSSSSMARYSSPRRQARGPPPKVVP